jgi:DNA processing protein
MNSVNMLTLGAAGYPSGLENISSPPRHLYWRGVDPKEWLNRPKVAIVGSRKMTAYGQAVTTDLARQLAAAGVVIISGLAFGVDITAHKAALSVNGVTVAVIATGLDNITPRSNYQVAQEILQKGTILSEQPFGKMVNLGLFVIRNRIISGLADIVLIPEAVLKSGSLHTARFALEQGKTVMAVPGNINSPASEGSNNLIKSGAIPVTCADDILFALNINPAATKNKRPSFSSHQEQIVFDLIQKGVCQQDDIATAAGIDVTSMSAALTMLEISGHIRPAGAGNWLTA